MAKVTLLFAFLLVVLGLVGFFGTDSVHPTALIPTCLGLLLCIFGLLAISPSERQRKLFMHINVTLVSLAFWAARSRLLAAIFTPHQPVLSRTRSLWPRSSRWPV